MNPRWPRGSLPVLAGPQFGREFFTSLSDSRWFRAAPVSRHVLPIELVFTQLFEKMLAGLADQGSAGKVASLRLLRKAPEEIFIHRDFDDLYGYPPLSLNHPHGFEPGHAAGQAGVVHHVDDRVHILISFRNLFRNPIAGFGAHENAAVFEALPGILRKG